MNFPCPNRTRPCADPADAILAENLTAEAPDALRYFSIVYGTPWAGGDEGPEGGSGSPPRIATGPTQQDANDNANTPPNNGLGNDFPPQFASRAQTCEYHCSGGETVTFTAPASLFIASSQSVADALAMEYACTAAALLCAVQRFTNTEQTCETTCEDESTASYTVPAGSFGGETQEAADAAAYAFACNIASQLCGGGSPPVVYSSAAQSCTVPCPSGAITFGIAAGTAQGLTQEEADSAAHAIACAAASRLCPVVPPPAWNTRQTCIGPCGASVTIPAGVYSAATVEAANSLAYALACTTAAVACNEQEPPPPAPSVGNQDTICTVSCPNGTQYTSSVPSRRYFAPNVAAANAIALSNCQIQANTNKICLSDIQSVICRGSAYSATITATGTVATWAVVSGSLPPGVSFAGGILTGTVTTAGSYSFTVGVTRANGDIATRAYTIVVVAITTASLPGVTAGNTYLATVAQSGFSAPFWSVTAGALPPGLSLNNTTGAISGTVPAATGTGSYAFTIGVKNGAAGTLTCTKALSITVTALPQPGPDWPMLLWGTPSTIVPVGCSYTQSPNPGNTGDSFIITGENPDVHLKNLQYDVICTLVYGGDAANCNLNLILDLLDSGDPDNIGIDIKVQLGVFPFTIYLDEHYEGGDSGVYNIPFSVPSGATPIRVRVAFGLNNFFAPSMTYASVDIRGTLSNV